MCGGSPGGELIEPHAQICVPLLVTKGVSQRGLGGGPEQQWESRCGQAEPTPAITQAHLCDGHLGYGVRRAQAR